MKWHVYLLALCLLLVLVSTPVLASGPSVDMPVAMSFSVSGVARATDSVLGGFSPGPGKIDISKGDHVMYIRLTAPGGNGTRLASLDDYESGIVFRNNTFLLPLYTEDKDAGALIVTTDNLTADSYGYTGAITALQLDSGKINASRDGQSYTASVLISLTDLPAGAAYRFACTDNATPVRAISAELEASGLTAGAAMPLLDVSAGSAAAVDAISFIIVTVETGRNWTRLSGDNNLTFYRYSGDELSHLRFTATRATGGGIVFQAISPGTGQFTIVAPVPVDRARENVSAGGTEIFLMGGLLAVLLIALAAMVRRVTKR